MLILRSLECEIEKLVLIDNDVIEEKNLPYLFISSRKYVSFPKSEVLKEILTDLSSTQIIAYNDTYPDLTRIGNYDRSVIEESIMIDCRDTPSESSKFSIKVNIDGHYGIINRGPSDRDVTRSSRYTLGNSKYYAILFAGIISQFIFGNLVLTNNKTIIDLRKGEFHGVLSQGM